MNKSLASILKTELSSMPVIEKIAGLVRTEEYEDTFYDETGTVPTKTVKKIPVSCDVTLGSCDQNDLVPDSAKKGILYFEDNGIIPLGQSGIYTKWRSKLRLVCWLNTKYVTGESCSAVSAIVMNSIVSKLYELTSQNRGFFLKMNLRVENIPKVSKAIFSEYTYDLYNTQYLMAPYEYFAIDLMVEFEMHPSCIDQLTLNENTDNC